MTHDGSSPVVKNVVCSLESVLNSGQVVGTPAAQTASVLMLVNLTFKLSVLCYCRFKSWLPVCIQDMSDTLSGTNQNSKD
jgi:hypothetical protein